MPTTYLVAASIMTHVLPTRFSSCERADSSFSKTKKRPCGPSKNELLGAARKHTKEESLSHSQIEKGGADVRFVPFVWVCPVCPLCVSRLPPVLLRSIYMYLD